MRTRFISGRSHRAVVALALALVITLGAAPPGRAQQPADEALSLPSFSIFGLPATASTASDKLITAKELEKFIAGAEKARAARSAAGPGAYYSIVPVVFYRIRGLFGRSAWTKQEIKEGLDVSAFFARIFDKPGLKMDQADPQFFRKGLQTLRNWFVTLCQDNRTLGWMIYTDDSGPFFGQDVEPERIGEMKVLESVAIPEQHARFVLMKEKVAAEPIVMGVVNDDGGPRWLKRLSAAPVGAITSASFIRRSLSELEGYGYVCGLMAEWNLGFRQSVVYLDESLNLRFYFVAS